MSEWVPTTCMRCAVGCGLSQRGVDLGYGLDVVRGDAAHPVSRGLACNRGTSETADPDGESPAPTDSEGVPLSADD